MKKYNPPYNRCTAGRVMRSYKEDPEVNRKHKRRVIIMSAVSIIMVTWLIFLLENLPG